MDDVLVAAELAALVRGLVALDVPGPLQFVDGGTNSVLALPVDIAQAGQGVIPILRISIISIQTNELQTLTFSHA